MGFGMKKIFVLVLALAGAFVTSAQSSVIRVHQIGYFPEGAKVAIAVNVIADSFLVRNLEDQSVAWRGQLGPASLWRPGAEVARWADFSALRTEGYFRLEVPGVAYSTPFKISHELYLTPFYHVLRSFYFQRASTDIPEEFGGVWARSFGHADTGLRYHPDLGKPADARRDVPRGWYDAGDYGKYVVNSGVTMGWMQSFALIWPSLVPDGFSNIPESGSGISDFLDELRWQMHWMFTMQDDDGGVFFKVTPLNFEGTVMPTPNGTREMLIIGKSTTSALNFAAVMAQASRLWRPIDEAYADSCLNVARRAWEWAVANPNIPYRQGQAGLPFANVRTGEYGDNNFSHEFFWAGVELFLSTGENSYRERVISSMPNSVATAGWANPSAIGFFSLALSDNPRDSALAATARRLIISSADGLMAEINSSPYALYNMDFNWGSNGTIAGVIGHLIITHRLTNNQEYLHGAVKIADYFFGKNPLNLTYITGMGFHSVQRPHSRYMEADSVAEPVPGFIAGGANTQASGDAALSAVINAGCAPAACYTDVYASYASNEVAINWQAPLLFALGGLQAELGGSDSLHRNNYERVQLAVMTSGPGTVSVYPRAVFYTVGDTVQLVAQTSGDSQFFGWSSGLSGTDTLRSIVMQRNMLVRAHFVQEGLEMILNGNFSDSTIKWAMTPWTRILENHVGGEVFWDSGAARISMNYSFKGTQNNHIALMQGPILIGNDYSYTLSFRARSVHYRTGQVVIRRGPTTYFSTPLSFGPQWADYRFSFTVSANLPDTDQAMLRFEVGGDSASVWLDSISLKMLQGALPADIVALQGETKPIPLPLQIQQSAAFLHIMGGKGQARLRLISPDGKLRHVQNIFLDGTKSTWAIPLTGLHLAVIDTKQGRASLWVVRP